MYLLGFGNIRVNVKIDPIVIEVWGGFFFKASNPKELKKLFPVCPKHQVPIPLAKGTCGSSTLAC